MRLYLLVFLFNAAFAFAETTGCQYCIDYCVSAAATAGQPTQSCTQVCQSLSYTDCPGMPSPSPTASPMPTASPTVSIPPTPPATGFTTIYSTQYPTTPYPSPTTGMPYPEPYPYPYPYPEPIPTAPVFIAPAEPPGWPRPTLNFNFGNCYAHGVRLGYSDTNPTFVNVTYSCQGASDASSVVGVSGGNDGSGGVSFYFYNSRNGKTCYGSAVFNGTNAYTGSMSCPGGSYPVTFY